MGQGTGLRAASKIHLWTACTLTWKERDGEIISHSTFPIVLTFKLEKESPSLCVNYISIFKKGKKVEKSQIS